MLTEQLSSMHARLLLPCTLQMACRPISPAIGASGLQAYLAELTLLTGHMLRITQPGTALVANVKLLSANMAAASGCLLKA